MTEKTANLYNQPSKGLASEWYGRNQTSEANLRILDMTVAEDRNLLLTALSEP